MGVLVEVERLCVVGVDLDGLGLWSRVDGVAGDGLRLRDHQGTHHPVDLDLAVLVRLVEAVTGDVAVLVGDKFAGRR